MPRHLLLFCQTAGAMLVCKRLFLSSKPKYTDSRPFSWPLPLVLHFNLLDRDFAAATHVATHGFPPALGSCLISVNWPPVVPVNPHVRKRIRIDVRLTHSRRFTTRRSPSFYSAEGLRVRSYLQSASQGSSTYTGFDIVKLCPPLRHTPFFKTHAKYL